MKQLANIFWLGTKELRSLQRDTVLVLFVIYAFTFAIYTQAKGTSSEVHNASIAFVDEDQSTLSKRLFESFYPPRFKHPQAIAEPMGHALNEGLMALLVDLRARLRKEKNFAMADEIRNRLTDLGVTLEDRPDGTRWRIS